MESETASSLRLVIFRTALIIGLQLPCGDGRCQYIYLFVIIIDEISSAKEYSVKQKSRLHASVAFFRLLASNSYSLGLIKEQTQ